MATTAPKLTYVGLATISKVETTPDGNRIVYGKATDETLDGDKQIVDLKWAKGALADWLKTGGNLRVQHNPMLYPAGVGVELDATDQGHWLKSNVGEPTAIKLLDLGALSAYSVVSLTPRWFAMLRHRTAESSAVKLWRSVWSIDQLTRPAVSRSSSPLMADSLMT